MADANYSNTALPTTLSGSISAGATTITVGATTGFPVAFPYTLALDYGAGTEELVSVTAAAGLNLTVARGFSGTSAQSHSLGAAVRHVYHAGDATDFRTHQDATTGVHGVTGALVGATQTQTLTNKTLTSPTINSGTLAGGALSGTFTGTPTLSGAVVLSGTPSISNGAALAGTLSGAPTFSGNVTFSGSPTFSGLLTASARAVVSATAAAVPLTVTGAASQSADLVQVKNSSAAELVSIDSTGLLTAAAGADLTGNAGAVTIRQGSGDGLLTVSSQDGVTEYLVVTESSGTRVLGGFVWLDDPGWTTYTPAWSSTGTAPAIGNGTITGRYKQIGKTVHATIFVRFGTTTTFGTGTYGFSLPKLVATHAQAEFGHSGTARGHAAAWYHGAAVVAPNVQSGTVRVFTHGGSTEWSPTVPVTWSAASSNYINISLTYETSENP